MISDIGPFPPPPETVADAPDFPPPPDRPLAERHRCYAANERAKADRLLAAGYPDLADAYLRCAEAHDRAADCAEAQGR